jgi:cobalamin biosynthesis protein CobT
VVGADCFCGVGFVFNQLTSILDRLQTKLVGLDGTSYRVFAREFDRIISGQTAANWLELGQLDHADVEQIVGPKPDHLVTLLVDHSGSMRGRPGLKAVAACKAVADHLRGTGVPLEILGFTTRSWHGGLSGKKYAVERGTYPPGRVCDLLHIVYQDGMAPNERWYEQMKAAFAQMHVLKENIDGEAVVWAADRARNTACSSWTLLVISDGAPSDECTLRANGELPKGGSKAVNESLLTRHLSHIVSGLNEQPHITIAALGIGHDASNSYGLTAVVELDGDAGSAMRALFQKTEELRTSAQP